MTNYHFKIKLEGLHPCIIFRDIKSESRLKAEKELESKLAGKDYKIIAVYAEVWHCFEKDKGE